MKVNRRAQKYVDFLLGEGIEILDVSTTGGSHYKIHVRAKGQERFFIAPYSPSDRRAFLNWKSDARRWLRGIEGNP